MRRPIASAVLAAATAMTTVGAAAAADLGSPYGRPATSAYPPRYGAPLSIERWTGFYFGATYGGVDGSDGTSGDIGRFRFDQSGGVGTLFGGYNWQLGNAVVGLEADIGTGSVSGAASSSGMRVTSDLNAFGSVRARAGFLLTPDLLLYGTGGYAWGDYDFKLNDASTRSATLSGYQIGAGAEWMIAPQWTLRLEYVFTDLASERFEHGSQVNTYDPDFHTVRAGVSFKF